jgi:hypothetical protein
MLSEESENPTILELAIRGLKEEHAACVKRIGCMAADPERRTEIEGYLSRIENINQALIRLAGARAATFAN